MEPPLEGTCGHGKRTVSRGGDGARLSCLKGRVGEEMRCEREPGIVRILLLDLLSIRELSVRFPLRLRGRLLFILHALYLRVCGRYH